jgi:hypothetical protein
VSGWLSGSCVCCGVVVPPPLPCRKLIRPWTVESMGNCKFMDSCHNFRTCKYVHWEDDPEPDAPGGQQQLQGGRRVPKYLQVCVGVWCWLADWLCVWACDCSSLRVGVQQHCSHCVLPCPACCCRRSRSRSGSTATSARLTGPSSASLASS